MGQADVCYSFAAVDFDPDEILGGRGIEDVVSGIVWEDGGVTSGEVDCASCLVADEDCGLCRSFVEV